MLEFLENWRIPAGGWNITGAWSFSTILMLYQSKSSQSFELNAKASVIVLFIHIVKSTIYWCIKSRHIYLEYWVRKTWYSGVQFWLCLLQKRSTCLKTPKLLESFICIRKLPIMLCHILKIFALIYYYRCSFSRHTQVIFWPLVTCSLKDSLCALWR